VDCSEFLKVEASRPHCFLWAPETLLSGDRKSFREPAPFCLRLSEQRSAAITPVWNSTGRIQNIFTVRVTDNGGQLKAGKPEPFLETQFVEDQPHFSRDGRWLAYQSNESGRLEVSVRAFRGHLPAKARRFRSPLTAEHVPCGRATPTSCTTSPATGSWL
jgi:hypothetical protein